MKYNLLCFAIGVLFGLFLGLMYSPLIYGGNTRPTPVHTARAIKKDVAQLETGYNKSFDTRKTECASTLTNAQYTGLKTALKKAWRANSF